MSEHLSLYPLLDGPRALQKTYVLLYETLLVPAQNYALYAQIDVLNFVDGSVKVKIKTKPIPDQLWIEKYGDEGRTRTRDNSYGEELHYVYAEQLKKWHIGDDAHWSTKAVKAYIDQLPNDTPILILF
jgi:hypothetical protein